MSTSLQHLISLYIDYNKSRSSVPVTALISDATSCRCGTWIAPSISRELCEYAESVCPSPSGAFGYARWRVARINERDHCPKRTTRDPNITRVRRTSPLPPPSLRTSCSSSLHSELNYLAHPYTVWPRSFTQTRFPDPRSSIEHCRIIAIE